MFFDTLQVEGGFYEEKLLKEAITKCITTYNRLYADVLDMVGNPKKFLALEDSLRQVAFGVARVFVAALLLQAFVKTGLKFDKEILMRWITQDELYSTQALDRGFTKAIALDLDKKGDLRGVGDKDAAGVPRARF